MKAKEIKALYQRYKNIDRISIIGCSPDVKNDLEKHKITSGLVIVLNSAFLLFPNYDIHFVANMEFRSLYQKQFTRKGILIRPNSHTTLNYQEEYYYYPSKTIFKDFNAIEEENNSLMASYSCLIPALHFALRCEPQRVVLYGISLKDTKHWDNQENFMTYFPGSKKICAHVNHLKCIFKKTGIRCLNRNSLLINKRILKA